MAYLSVLMGKSAGFRNEELLKNKNISVDISDIIAGSDETGMNCSHCTKSEFTQAHSKGVAEIAELMVNYYNFGAEKNSFLFCGSNV